MRKQMQAPIDELFRPANAGALRVALFAKFYEDLLRAYFTHRGYEVLPGKPRIFWKKIPLPVQVRSGYHARLATKLRQLQRHAAYCTPDGLLRRDNRYFVWEAKNWVQELFPSPFTEWVWDVAGFLARQVAYRRREYEISGFIVSWWDHEQGMSDALAELRKCVAPVSVELVIIREVLQECVGAGYEWYIALVRNIRNNIDQFFDVLLGHEER